MTEPVDPRAALDASIQQSIAWASAVQALLALSAMDGIEFNRFEETENDDPL